MSACQAPMPKQACLALLLVLCLAVPCSALDNGLARKPQLGFNTWNCFGADIDEDLIKETADLLVTLGLKDAGYEYLVIDDGWSERTRDTSGRLLSNQERFPSGMKRLARYVHNRGLKFGIYSDAGAFTCQHFPGSRGFEDVDAATFASWDVDYLKYDNCYAPAADWVINRYQAMRDALNKTGRPILYSLCEWGVADPWLWAPEIGNSWRTTTDVSANWESILSVLDNTIGLARYAGPGHWNDPDMLEVGNGDLTVNEQRAHFALWALLKSPMLIGADLRTLDPTSLAILKSREILEVHQDDLGVAGDLIWKQGAKEIYATVLADGSRAAVLFNRHMCDGRDTQYPISKITVHWEQLGLEAAAPARVRDLYAEQDLGVFTGSYTAAVDIHDVAALRITPLDASVAAASLSWRPWHVQNVFASYPEDNRVEPPPSLMGAGGEAGARRMPRRGGPKGAGSVAFAPDLQ